MSTIVLCATYTHSVFRGEGRSSGPELDMTPLGEGANVRLLISQCGDLLSLHSSAQTFSPVSVRLSCVVAALIVLGAGPPYRWQLPAHRAVLGAHAPGRGSPGRDVAQHFSDPPSTNRMIGPSRRGTPARPAPNSKSSDSHRLFRPPLCKDHRAGVSALTHVRKVQVAVPVDKPACDGLENKLANKQTNENPLGEFRMPRGSESV